MFGDDNSKTNSRLQIPRSMRPNPKLTHPSPKLGAPQSQTRASRSKNSRIPVSKLAPPSPRFNPPRVQCSMWLAPPTPVSLFMRGWLDCPAAWLAAWPTAGPASQMARRPAGWRVGWLAGRLRAAQPGGTNTPLGRPILQIGQICATPCAPEV